MQTHMAPPYVTEVLLHDFNHLAACLDWDWACLELTKYMNGSVIYFFGNKSEKTNKKSNTTYLSIANKNILLSCFRQF